MLAVIVASGIRSATCDSRSVTTKREPLAEVQRVNRVALCATL